MPFTMEDVLNEFTEAAATVTDWTAEAEFRLLRNAMAYSSRNKERAAEWYALPWNHKHKNDYMREYGRRPDVKARRNAANATPEAKAKLREKNRAYYLSEHGSAVRAAHRKLRNTPEYRAKERERQLGRIRGGYFKQAARTERAKREGVSG